MEKRDLTRLLGWPGYRVYRYEVDEAAKALKVWVRKKPVHRGFECSGCGRRVHAVVATWEREVADLDCGSAREFEKPPIGGDLGVLPFLDWWL
jgi:hypothetical protein